MPGPFDLSDLEALVDVVDVLSKPAYLLGVPQEPEHITRKVLAGQRLTAAEEREAQAAIAAACKIIRARRAEFERETGQVVEVEAPEV